MDFEVKTVQEMGWSGKKNGQLLTLSIDSGFEIFITSDKNIQFQQNVKNFKIKIIILNSILNRYQDLKKLLPECFKKLDEAPHGAITLIGEILD